MIGLDNIIEFQTNSPVQQLSFATQYLVGINFTFSLTVVSGRFRGTDSFCVRIDEIEQFCADISVMHGTLQGSALLSDNDSDAFVRLSIASHNQVTVGGRVGGSYSDHSVTFEFVTDQMCLPGLVTDFKTLLANAAKR